MLARESQIYLGALGAARNTKRGKKRGMTEEDLDEMAMILYCSRAGPKDNNGHLINAQPFKYIRAAKYLRRHRKFGGVCKAEESAAVQSAIRGQPSTRWKAGTRNKGSVAVVLGDDDDKGVDEHLDGDVEDEECELVSRRCTKGVKAKKKEEREVRGDDK